MRKLWNRASELVQLDERELTVLIQTAVPGDEVVAAEFAEGGLANTNIRLKLKKRKNDLLLRLITRDGSQAGKEYNILRRIADIVPVPRVYDFAESNPINGHPFILMEWLDQAQRFETILDSASNAELLQMGSSIGSCLAAIHSVGFDACGFFDSELNVVVPITIGGAGLVQFAEECLITKGGETRLGSALTKQVMAFLESESKLLDEWSGPPSLTHADFGGSNILVRNHAGSWNVAAILDWEFAFSGSPLFDLGNLLRSPIQSIPGFVDAVARGYQRGGGTLPEEWRRMSLLVDMTAWFDFMTRATVGPELVHDAQHTLVQTMDKWNTPKNN